MAWAAALGVAAFVVATVLSHRVFAAMPHVQDSIAQLFQARIFASGDLVAAAPAHSEFFRYHHMILEGGRWYSQYPPGHPLLLALVVLVGVPWMINPLAGGLFVTALVLLGGELFGSAVGRIAGFLALVSPFFLLMSAEFMSHATALAAVTWGLWGYLRAWRTRRARDGVLAGAAFGLALLIRPYSLFGIGIPIALHVALATLGRGPGLVSSATRHSPARAGLPGRGLVAMAATLAVATVVLLAYNHATNGSPLRFGYEALYGPSHGLGFGKGSWGPAHTLPRGLAQVGSQVSALHARLFEWPLTSLWPLALGLLPGAGATRRWALLAFPVALLGVHVFYWYSDLCFGPRYVYEALGPVLILSACGIRSAARTADGLLARTRRGRSVGRAGGAAGGRSAASPSGDDRRFLAIAVAMIAVLSAAGMVTRWPALFRPPAAFAEATAGSPLRAASYFQYFGPQYWGVGPNLHRVIERDAETPALVFVRFQEPVVDHPTMRYLLYGSAFAFQEPRLDDAAVIYARDLGEANVTLLAEWPDRRAYIYEGNVESGSLRTIR